MIRVKRLISVFLLTNLIFSGFLACVDYARATNIKTVVITFATTPTSPQVSKAELKYNKDFAFSYTFDDGLITGFDPAFKYLNGGYSDYLGQYFGGLYFTDGAGNNVPFRAGYAFYSRNPSYSDIHVNTPSYIKWTQLQEAVDGGWNIFNHGYTSASVSPSDPNYVFYTGDPGGHATGSLDYNYELLQNNVNVASHISLKNNSGTVVGPFNISQVILPNGDDNYIQPAFNNGYTGVYAQSGIFPFDGSTTTAPNFTNVNDAISSNRHVMPRWFDYEYRYLPAGQYPGALFDHVDQLASMSTGATKYWTQEFTHQVTTSTYYPDWNGGITWTTWKSLMDHIENTYGRFGNDKAWVAGAEEVYDYMMVKQNSGISQNLVGNVLTVQIDITNVPASLKNYALSLLVSSSNSAAISSIDYGTDFAYHTDNKTTGLINLDWGLNSYSKNDITRVETLVATAESSKRKSDVDLAKNYVNLLPASSAKTAYTNRLNAVVIPLRTWYVKVRGGVTSALNCYSTSTTAYSPSVYNWNTFYVGKNSLICSDLTNLRDSDNQISSMSLSNTAAFDGGLQSSPTGNNSGVYPDAVLDSSPNIYKAAATPAKVKIYGLENTKTYNIKLFGYTSASVNNNTKDNTVYTIGSATKTLMVAGNILNTVEFLNVLPVSGEIEVSIVPQNTAWGYGMLNAMEIKENILAAPSALSYSSNNVYTKNNAITPLSPTVTGLGITYSISPALPTGLTMSTSTGIISGTPAASYSLATYTVTATNTGGSTSFGITMTVNNAAPSALSYASPKVYSKNNVITPLSPTVSGEGITYSVSPTLPTGLSLNTDTGIIFGTPTATSSAATYIITATNNGGNTTFNLSITVNNSAPANLSYTSPNVYIKDNAITPLPPTVTGSELSYSISPSLPTGLTMSTSTGIISGTPTTTSTSTIYTVTATNSGGSTTFDLTITVNNVAPSALSYDSPKVYYKNTAITSLSPIVSGEGITYSISPSLPTGLTMSTSTGIISGTPTTTSTSTVYTITATNSGGSTTFDLTITVNNISPSSFSYASPKVYYKNTAIIPLVPAISGEDLTYSVSPSLPAGLSLNTDTGIISGTPIATSIATVYTITTTNSGGSTTFDLTITVNNVAPSALSYASPKVYYKNTAITPLSPTVSGEGITYSISPSLLAGLIMSTSTGIISGTPSATSSLTTYTVTATNSGGSTTFDLTITINNVAPSALSYASPKVYSKNTAITPLAPTISGQDLTYSISPTLPVGLSLNTNTGIISGTSSATSSLITYTITATNSGGSTTFDLDIRIDNISPSSLSYTSPKVYSKNTAITPLLPIISGEDLIYSITPSLPVGLNMSTSTGIVSGTPTVTSTSTTYTITAINSGGSVTFDLTITINNIAPTNLSYTSPNGYSKNNPITPLNPTISGEDLTYSISPSLPTGLTMSTSTGIISGTPSVTSNLTTYIITATNSGGSTTFDLTITINNAAPSALSYASPKVYSKSVTIAPLAPTVSGEGITYSVSPTLPTGLSLNTSTGIISGTPTATSSLTFYTITAINNGGSTTFDLSITVNNSAPTNLSYASPKVYKQNTAITALNPTISGQDLNYSISPSLPAGLTMNTNTGVISGTPAATSSVTVYTITATNNGGSTTFDLTITVEEFSNITYLLSYNASANGSILGTSSQLVDSGANGTVVTVIANSGYHFVKWSDGLTSANRAETGVSSDLSFTAEFAIDEVASVSTPVSLPRSVGSGVSETSIPMNTVRTINSINSSGINVLAYINSQANFQTPESSNNWQAGNHSLKISNLDLYTDTITITLSSKPQIVTLKKGESREVDLDADTKNDILVSFINVYVNRAEVTIKSLAKEISTPTSSPAPLKTKTFVFSKDLKLKTVNPDVKELQKFLNAAGYLIAQSGPGSKGRETTTFGSATKEALIKFQKAKKIKPASGLFGPLTRKVINGK